MTEPRVGEGAAPRDRVLTLPNVLSALRLVLVPVFLWLIVTEHDAWALIVLVVSGASDYADGKIARRFGLESRLGELLDPVADRLYILSTLLGLAWRDIIPWWLVAVLLAREVVVGIALGYVKQSFGITGLPVHFVGKAATLNLLYAFPLLLLGQGDGGFAAVAEPVGWAFAWWGTVLYWVAGLMYLAQVGELVSRRRAVAS